MVAFEFTRLQTVFKDWYCTVDDWIQCLFRYLQPSSPLITMKSFSAYHAENI